MTMLCHDNYGTVVATVKDFGTRVAPRGKSTLELLGSRLLMPPDLIWIRRKRGNLRLAMLESLMIAGGIFELDLIGKIAPRARLDLYKTQSDYGPRMHRQLVRAQQTLWDDPDSRRAVVNLNDKMEPLGDMTCLTSVQFLLRNGCLRTMFNVRSWDLVYGFVTDLVTFQFLHNVFASSMGAEPGAITVNIGSIHLYEETQSLAEEKGGPHQFKILESDFTNTWPSVSESCRDMARFYADHPDELPFVHESWAVKDNGIFLFQP